MGTAATQGLVWLERATHAYVLAALAIVVLLASLPWGAWGGRVLNAMSFLRWCLPSRQNDEEESAAVFNALERQT